MITRALILITMGLSLAACQTTPEPKKNILVIPNKIIQYEGKASFHANGNVCNATYDFEWTRLSRTTSTSTGAGVVQCNGGKTGKFSFTENRQGLLTVVVPGYTTCIGTLGKIINNIGIGRLICENGTSGEFMFQLRSKWSNDAML